MELDGNEKRIRALFSELSFQDQGHTPRFEELWRRAERSGVTTARDLRRAAVVMTFAALIIATAAVLAARSWSTTPNFPVHNAANDALGITSPTTAPSVVATNKPASATEPNRRHHPRKLRVERITNRAITEAETLSRWQSPTNILMTSPTGEVFNALPKLNQSAEELKQFLPKENDATKESNQ